MKGGVKMSDSDDHEHYKLLQSGATFLEKIINPIKFIYVSITWWMWESPEINVITSLSPNLERIA